MKRPSKKEIAEMVDKLKAPKEGEPGYFEQRAPQTQEKKANKNRIRKKGV